MLLRRLYPLVNGALARLGAAVVPVDAARTMARGLRNVSRLHGVRTVIDVGASDGQWTREARRHYPHASYLLVEAQATHEPALRRLRSEIPRLEYVMAAAGRHAGKLHFDASDPFGGVASESHTGANDVVVQGTTVDAEVARRRLEGPFLLKLDTHGFEVPILDGARETLKQTEVLVVEVYNFPMAPPESLLFPALCEHVARLGFRCLDIVDVMHRPKDGALWQFDAVFVPATSREFADASF